MLWDARNRVRLAALDIPPEGVLALIRDVDRTFKRRRRTYSAVNDQGFAVDVIRPLERNEATTKLRGVGDDRDIEAAAIEGLIWLINAPKFEHVAIDERGMPVRIVCVDPRVFALHKFWLAQEAPLREAGKRRRDRAQALTAAILADRYLRLSFEARDLSALPLRLVQHAKALVTEAQELVVEEIGADADD